MYLQSRFFLLLLSNSGSGICTFWHRNSGLRDTRSLQARWSSMSQTPGSMDHFLKVLPWCSSIKEIFSLPWPTSLSSEKLSLEQGGFIMDLTVSLSQIETKKRHDTIPIMIQSDFISIVAWKWQEIDSLKVGSHLFLWGRTYIKWIQNYSRM